MDLNFVLFPPPSRNPANEKPPEEGKTNWRDSLIYIDSLKSEEDEKRHKIPCIFVPGRGKKLLVYFHGNGEDLYSTHDLAESL